MQKVFVYGFGGVIVKVEWDLEAVTLLWESPLNIHILHFISIVAFGRESNMCVMKSGWVGVCGARII